MKDSKVRVRYYVYFFFFYILFILRKILLNMSNFQRVHLTGIILAESSKFD